MLICRDFTGATGLEPATSGVTGRSWSFRGEREWAGICGLSRTLRHVACGDYQMPAGASGEILRDVCGMRPLSHLATHGSIDHAVLDSTSPRSAISSSRILNFWTLPVTVIGKAVDEAYERGTL